jgi:hypothetical protein
LLHAENAPCRLLPWFPPDVGEAAGAELLHFLMLSDFERADRIGEFWGHPETRTFAELLIDCEEGCSGRCSSGCFGRLSAESPRRMMSWAD